MSNEYLQILANKLEAASNTGKLKPSDWIVKNTFLGTEPYSFHQHEFQKDIIDCNSREVIVQKCCQIGATEVFVRLALEIVANRGFDTILTQPDFNMSKGFSKSRINPVIEQSPKLSSLIKDSNAVDLKGLGDAFLYIKYTKGAESLALSTPADCIIADEVDHSDPKNLKLFRSRLEHSKYRYERFFGTPTIPKRGISQMLKLSEKRNYMVKCPSCGTWNDMSVNNLINFPIDIFQDNEPDFPTIHKELLYSIEDKVYIGCIKCGASFENSGNLLIPESSNKLAVSVPERAWVPENENADKNAPTGFLINQLATGLKSGRMVVQSMRGYEDMRDIYNQILGLPYASAIDSITEDDLVFSNYTNVFPPFTVGGLDFGKTCSLLILYPDVQNHEWMVCKTYELPLVTLSNEENIITELQAYVKKHNIICLAMDAMPYPSTVAKIKKVLNIPAIDVYLSDKYERIVFNGKSMTYKYGRTASIDNMLSDFKTRRALFSGDCKPDKETLKIHFTNFIKDINRRTGNYYYPKLSGVDHYGFAYMYSKIAFKCLDEFQEAFEFEEDNYVPFAVGNVRLKS